MKCAMQMRAIHKKRENMAATSASRLQDCSNPPPSTPVPSECAFQRGGNPAWHFSSCFMLTGLQHWPLKPSRGGPT